MTQFTQLQEWLAYLEQLNPNRIELGLDRVAQVGQLLNVTSFNCPVITVAGTNGKGSCVKTLESIFLAAGYRVGAYTSPHLFHFNERVRINGAEVANDDLCRSFIEVSQAQNEVALTYFEFTTLAGLWLFQQAQLDVVILEVGLGGRLDAVNIVDADIAVITTISLDHMEWLGRDRESIGREKAGIFRDRRPAVLGDFTAVDSIKAEAKRLQVPLFQAGQDYDFKVVMPAKAGIQSLQGVLDASLRWHDSGTSWIWQSNKKTLTNLPMPHLPLQNVATALMAIELVADRLSVPENAIHNGIKQAILPGRWQVFHTPKAPLIFDVAHNPGASQWLLNRLQSQPCTGRIFAVIAMLADKDIPGTLSPLIPAIDSWYVASLEGPRAAKGATLMLHLQALGAKKCYNFASVPRAVEAAYEAANPMDMIVIFGSFYTVAAAQTGLAKLIGENCGYQT